MADLLTGTAEVDLVVIGGGVAGIAAASRLADRDVVLLEADERLGGRLHSLAREEVWVNLGAHVLTGGDSDIKRLVTESGLDVLPIPGIKTALWFDGRLYCRRRVEAYPFVLPLTVRERLDLIRVGSRLRVGVARWRRATRPRRHETPIARATRLRHHRSDTTFDHLLLGRSPRVARIFEAAARRSAGEADRLTEAGAFALFGALWVSSGSASVVNVAGGSGRLGTAWQQRLGDRAVPGARVTSVTERGDHVEVVYQVRGAAARRLRAQKVVVAIPAPDVPAIVTDLPGEVRAELERVEYGSFVCLGVLTQDLPAVPWDDIYAITTPGAEFDMLFHHSNPVARPPGVRAPRSLMCYVGGERATRLLQVEDDEIRRRFLAQLVEVLPEVEGAVAEAIVMKWPYGNCYPVRGASLACTERWNRRHGARVVLAGDYFSPWGGTLEAAAQSGLESAGMLTNAEDGPAVSGHRPESRGRTFNHD